ncbi:hypothetical protein BN440_3695 [Erwinia amylovora MR1]|nr:hypothetical protein BN440_3695 [Erwinia amylovora MR1]
MPPSLLVQRRKTAVQPVAKQVQYQPVPRLP